MAKKFLSTLKIVNLPSDPISGSDGELYFNSSASVAKIYQAGAWSVLGAGGGGGGGSTTVSTTEPASPEMGDSWYKNDTGEFYVYDGTYWVEVNGVIDGATTLNALTDVNIITPSDGDSLIWNSASSTWINQVASGGGGGATTTVSETAPATPSLGDTWYKQSTGSFFIYDGNYWVEVNGIIDSLTSDQVQDYASTLFTHNTHTGITATYDDANNKILLNVNLNPYLTQASASTIYLTQSSASTIYATQVDLDNIDALPSQSGNAGKYLTTSGSVASWGTLDLSLYLTQSSASTTYATTAALNNINGESDQFILPSQVFG
jgi:hypothetical protein